MRTYTLVASIVAHVTVACAVLFSTVIATNELPEPSRASVFIEVIAVPPPPRSAPRPPVVQSAPTAVVALVAPIGVHPEVDRPAVPDVFDAAPDDVFVGVGSGAMRDEIPPPPPPPAAAASGPLRVGGIVRAPEKIVHVPPKYPSLARSAGVDGVVILEAEIGEDGTIRDVRVLRTIPLLDQAAVEAVRQWRFTPTLLNGQPVSVLMTVTVAFTLE
jgi:periplasmic protein TonB